MSDIDTKLYDAMGQRFAVVKTLVIGKECFEYQTTTTPERFFDSYVIAKDLKYSEAQGIIKLLGEENVTS
jgi:hypothetical protein